jgi:hypothetical protein
MPPTNPNNDAYRIRLTHKEAPDYALGLIEAAALADAALFYEEFGEALDPAATDWDDLAWDTAAEEIGINWRDAAYRQLYNATLVTETERLARQ